MAAEKTKRKLEVAGNNRGTRDGLERRRWMKNSLGALGALGLGALALRGDERPKPEGAASPVPHPTPWREEKVFIFYSPDDDRWRADPGHKAVTRGQQVTWRAFGKPATLWLPEQVFVPPLEVQVLANGEAQSTVKATAKSGFHAYRVEVDGRSALGGSHPGIIVDP